MALHHFEWNGKERSVSINKASEKITLRFIDKEIIDQGFEKISFARGQSVENFIDNYRDEKREVVRDLILAVKERTDFTVFL